jgi:hypothetical protein
VADKGADLLLHRNLWRNGSGCGEEDRLVKLLRKADSRSREDIANLIRDTHVH